MEKRVSASPTPSTRVLVVDDHQFARYLLAKALSTRHECVAVESAAEALGVLEKSGAGSFAAVVTDYNMPDRSGLELLADIQSLDSSLAVVVVTAENEKEVVKRALRLGAHGYVEKGAPLEQLYDTVAGAVQATEKARRADQNLQVTEEVSRSQQKLLDLNLGALRDRVRAFYKPWKEASGDFASILPTRDGTFRIIATDVSGHDLNAAYASVYFQGMARGMGDYGASVADVFRAANVFLLRGWNKGTEVETSVAALGAVIDPKQGTVELLNCGFPLPTLTGSDGRPLEIEPVMSSPLGWFPRLPPPVTVEVEDGQLLFWSDGLEDLADRLGVDQLACAYRLLDDTHERESLLKDAQDDILVLRADLRMDSQRRPPEFVPIFDQRFAGDQGGEIDAIQTKAENSLRLVLPEIVDEKLSAVLLCLREALINAFEHGCENRPERTARLTLLWAESSARLLVEVSDDGEGHAFALSAHEQDAGELMLTEHRGLILMRNLCDEIKFSRQGRVVTMSFLGQPEYPET